MELKDYINAAIKEKNGVNELAMYLGVAPTSIADAKAHRRGLPAIPCVKLSKLLDVKLETIIAASELATERKEEKRAFWLPFVQNAQNLGRAASFAIILGTVTNFVTPTNAEASNGKDGHPNYLYYVKSEIFFMQFWSVVKMAIWRSKFVKCVK